MNRTETIDEAIRHGKEQIHAARLRAEKEVERAARQASRALGSRALDKPRQALREHPMLIGAVAGAAILGGLAAWMLNHRQDS